MHVTFFRDHFAKRFTTEQLTLSDLRERVLNAAAREKGKLPWLKLAVFGNKKTTEGSLRHDDNVQQISGIEIDCDTEKAAFGDVVAALKAIHISALSYTSPSHTADKPRWRILAPTSQLLPPAERAHLVARLNGALKAKLSADKIAAVESFTLSQAYFYGWLMNKPGLDHHAEVIEGDFIDLRDDLAQYEATGTVSAAATDKTATASNDDDRAHGFEAILAEMGDGEGLRGFNDPLSRAASSYVATYFEFLDEKKLKKLLRAAIDKAPKQDTAERAKSITRYKGDRYLADVIKSGIKKFTATLPVRLEHFVADMETHGYIYLPTRKPWPEASVDARIRSVALLDPDGRPVLDTRRKPKRILASEWLDRNSPIEAVTWAPGEAMIIEGRIFAAGGWFDHAGARVLNLYRPPTIIPGDPDNVAPWLDHIRRVYPNDVEHIIKWMAHRVQQPADKLNHALFFGGLQGIGKDSMIEPLKRAVGPWNFEEVTPQKIANSQFTGYLKSVVLRISEGRDLGEVNRFALYEAMKTIIAAPPDVHSVNEKHRQEYYIPNVNGVIITSNYLTNGIYLPLDDRRHYVCWSDCTKDDFDTAYWDKLWQFYECGGDRNVAAYLASIDLTTFNSKAHPPKTEAFWAIASANAAPEEIELIEVLDLLNNPVTVTVRQLSEAAFKVPHLMEFADWITDRRNRRQIPHRMDQVHYVPVRNDGDITKLWKIGGEKQAVYAKKELSLREQKLAVQAMINQARPTPVENTKLAEPFLDLGQTDRKRRV